MRKWIQQWVQAFFISRMPKSDVLSLGMRNVYVFFSRQGVLFLLLLLITFATGTNYGNNLILGLFFYLLSLWLVAAVLTFLQLSGLSVQVQHIGQAQAGGLVWVELQLSSQSRRPVRQIALSFYDVENKSSADDEGIAQLSPNDRALFLCQRSSKVVSLQAPVLVRLPVLAGTRGELVLPRLLIKSSYPLGVATAWAYGRFASTAWIYPRPVAPKLAPNWQKCVAQNELGQESFGGQEDFDRLDSYREGENLARVSWGHLARGVGMLSKHFTDDISPVPVLDYAAMPGATHEDKLSELAFLVLESKTPFCLLLPSGAGEQGAGEAFLNQCLLRLAQEP